ncbi:hypothetical protein HNQ60_005134 [Povalibacter uvarum]|uniref:Glyoxalase-like domain-containing protein n=1 Tax=Povalibacter uvarum TaxID=732238 RepID=A0A841HW86_9GAMM|nr:hypothetical protein [Povalibacter uvarum]
MNLQMSYTILRTTDLSVAERWYAKLLGRGPDNRPMKTLVQWNLSAQHGIGLSSRCRAAGSRVFVINPQRARISHSLQTREPAARHR